MAQGTLDRLRFYTWFDTSGVTVDYAPPLEDYPEFPREAGMDLFFDRYKSALGSNYWTYVKGQSYHWNMNWVEVSDTCQQTWGITCGSGFMLYPHIAIYNGPGIDGISLGSLLSITGTVLQGTFFYENEHWEPKETIFGLWSFQTNFRREA